MEAIICSPSQHFYLVVLTHKFLDMVTSSQLFLNLHAVRGRNYDSEIIAGNLAFSFGDSTGHPLMAELSFIHFCLRYYFLPT